MYFIHNVHMTLIIRSKCKYIKNSELKNNK